MNPYEPYECIFSDDERKQLIGQALTQLRKGKGLSQKEVAVVLDISQATYSTYERGRSEPTAEMLVRLSYFYGVSVDVIVQRDRLVKNAADAQKQIEEAKRQMQELAGIGEGNPEAQALLQAMSGLLEATERLQSASMMNQI